MTSPAHYLFFNTRDRNEGTNENSVFYIDKRSMPRDFMLTLESIQFPHHMYPFSSKRKNTTLYFQENGSSTTLEAPLTLRTNYNAESLAIELKAKLEAAGAETYTITYDNFSKRYTISSTGTFKIVDGEFNINAEIGHDVSQNSSFVSSLVLANPVDLSGTKYVDVISTLGGGLNYTTTGAYTVLARMPTVSSFGEVIFYEPTFTHSIVGHAATNTIGVALRDDRGFYIELSDNSYVSYSFQMKAIQGIF